MCLNPYYLAFILMLQHKHLLIPVAAAENGFRNNIVQSPVEIKAVEGKSVTMTCFYETFQKHESIRVEWTKDSHEVLTGTSSNLSSKPTDRFSQIILGTGAKMTIKNIQLNDTGVYLCDVIIEIPTLFKGSGNGTKLTVQVCKPTTYWPVWVFVAFVVMVIPIITILYLKKSWKEHLETQVVSDTVNEMNCEEHHAEERNPESLSSRGSSQWMASSLYESVDYFAVKQYENKESN